MWPWGMTRTACAGSRSSASRRPSAMRSRGAAGRDAAAVPDPVAPGAAGKPDALVVFMPSGRRGRFPLGTPLLQAARSLGVDIDSVCGGRAICGRCEVLVMKGEFAKHGVVSRPENLSPPGAAEENHAARRPLPAGHRLSCQARIQGDLVVDVPPTSQVHRQVIRKAAEARAITLDPVARLHYVEVREPDMHDPSGDLQRLEEALQREWQ